MNVAAILTGELPSVTMKKEIRALGSGVSIVTRRTVTTLKNALRRRVKKAGLGKLENAVRGETKPPRGPSADIVGRVFSSAKAKRAGGMTDILAAFNDGVRLSGSVFALPTDKVGRDGKSRKTPKSYGTRLKPVRFSPRLGALVPKDEKGPRYTIFFWLVRGPITIKPRLAFDAEYQRVNAGFPEKVVAEIERQFRKIGAV